MMRSLVVGLVLGAASSLRSAEKVTPIEKVIELLGHMQDEVEKDGKADAVQYDKYACFCKDEADEKNYEIEKSDKKINKLTAQINKINGELTDVNSDVKDLVLKVTTLSTSITTKAATRKTLHTAYVTAERNVSTGVDTLDEAIETLKRSKDDMSDDAKVDLVQIRALAVTVLGSKAWQEPPSYEYHSNDIIDLLQNIRKQFIQRKDELDKDEFESNSAFEKNDLNLKNQRKFANKDQGELEQVAEELSEEKGAATSDKNQETADRDADKAFLGELTTDCEAKATLFDQRSTARSGELTAMAKALEILKTDVSGASGANKKLVDLQVSAKAPVRLQHAAPAATRPATSFLQLRGARSATGAGVTARRALSVLSAASSKLNSQVLSLALAKAGAWEAASDDHFVKVRGIIKDLVAKLQADAAREASQQGFCVSNIATATGERDAAQAEIEKLQATKSSLSSEQEGLVKDIRDILKTVAEMRSALNDATELRNEERADNQETIRTANEGNTAVELALKTLNDFYAGQAFVQTGKRVVGSPDRDGQTLDDKAPDVFQGEYKGSMKTGTDNPVLGLMEVISSDFERTVSTVTTDETAAQTAYDTFKTDTDTDISTKEGTKDTKQTRVDTIEGLLTDNTDDIDDQEKLLQSAKDTLEALHAKCVAAEESYAERVAKREKEIEALKQATTILDEWQ